MTRYQWSNKFRDEIVVVEQTDGDWGDFILAIEKARTTFNITKVETFPNDATQSTLPVEDESLCAVHNVKMKERMGKNGKFYSHSQGAYPDLEWCSGHGFK